MSTVVWRREWTIYSMAMFAMSAAILISQGFHQNYTAHPHDAASRYWLAIPVFLLLQRLQPKVFTVLQFAFPAAAIAGFLLAKDIGGRSGIGTLDLIHFGDIELILGMLSLFSINWFGRDKLPLRILKIAGFIAGLAASLASCSRGGWLAIPIFIGIFFYFKMKRISWRMILASAVLATLTIVMAYSISTNVHQRVNEFVSDVAAFDQGNRDTPTGIRWQLYKAALEVFSGHPISGVGPEGFALEMKPMQEAGKITPAAAVAGRTEVHNDLLAKAAGIGVLGLIAMLAIYIAPFRLFLQATKSASGQAKRAGILGITFVSGCMVFGLTVEFLDLTMATAFYSFTVAVLLAACYNIHHGELSTQP
jgi:O-antigen ligase